MRHACKERFCGWQTGCCPYCSTNIKHDMARHVSSFHLDLGQLWRCPVSWCTQWKGTPQDCVNHIRKKHYINDSVKAANLGRWFPPWTVMREAWHTVLKTRVSGISTDAALFSANGSQLIHHYRVCVPHMHPCVDTFMIDILYFTIRACADAKWVAKRNQTSGTVSPTSSDSPVPLPSSVRHHMSDDESLACKAPRAVSPVMTGVSAQEATSTVVSAKKYCAPSVPKLCSVPYGWRRPILPVSLLLPLFADQEFEPTPVWSTSVVTQQYPSSPGSRASIVCVDLYDFDPRLFPVD